MWKRMLHLQRNIQFLAANLEYSLARLTRRCQSSLEYTWKTYNVQRRDDLAKVLCAHKIFFSVLFLVYVCVSDLCVHACPGKKTLPEIIQNFYKKGLFWIVYKFVISKINMNELSKKSLKIFTMYKLFLKFTYYVNFRNKIIYI